MLLENRCTNVGKILSQFQSVLHIDGRLGSSCSICLWSKLDEPIVVEIDRARDVFFPNLRFVRVDWHENLSSSSVEENSTNTLGSNREGSPRLQRYCFIYGR